MRLLFEWYLTVGCWSCSTYRFFPVRNLSYIKITFYYFFPFLFRNTQFQPYTPDIKYHYFIFIHNSHLPSIFYSFLRVFFTIRSDFCQTVSENSISCIQYQIIFVKLMYVYHLLIYGVWCWSQRSSGMVKSTAIKRTDQSKLVWLARTLAVTIIGK